MRTLVFLVIVFGLFASGCGSNPTASNSGNNSSSSVSVVWPTTGSVSPCAIHDCFGPRRLPSGYDFHAGIDIRGNFGDPIYAVMSGEVVSTDDYAITLKHRDGVYTSYLHLSTLEVVSGESVVVGEKIGEMGSYEATFVHLHFGYFVDMPSNVRNERYCHNPLEILPYEDSAEIVGTREGQRAEIWLNNDVMLANRFVLTGVSTSAALDYYEIVAQGSTERNNQTQNSIIIDVSDPVNDVFLLTLEAEFEINNVKAYDFDANEILSF